MWKLILDKLIKMKNKMNLVNEKIYEKKRNIYPKLLKN